MNRLRCDAVKSRAAAATAAVGGCVGRQRKSRERGRRVPAVPEVLAGPGHLAASHAGTGVAEGPGTCADDGRVQPHLSLCPYVCRILLLTLKAQSHRQNCSQSYEYRSYIACCIQLI